MIFNDLLLWKYKQKSAAAALLIHKDLERSTPGSATIDDGRVAAAVAVSAQWHPPKEQLKERKKNCNSVFHSLQNRSPTKTDVFTSIGSRVHTMNSRDRDLRA